MTSLPLRGSESVIDGTVAWAAGKLAASASRRADGGPRASLAKAT